MAKKKFGKFVALATVSGLIAAGVSYFVKYKSFHDDLEKDFHDFEGDDADFDGELPHETEVQNRTYVPLNEKKDDAVSAMTEGMEKITEAAADKTEDMTAAVTDKAADLKDAVADGAEKAADMATTIEEELHPDL
ncbi:MAG: hypothetical protein RR593_07125 [Hungatella sp.]